MSFFRSLFSFSRKEVQDAFAHSQRKGSMRGLKLLLCSAPSADHGKLLVVAPKNVGNAPKRNRLRRQIRSLYFEHKLYENRAITIVIAYPEAKEIPFAHLRDFLLSHLKNVGS